MIDQIRKHLEALVVAAIGGAMAAIAVIELPWPWVIPPVLLVLKAIKDLAGKISPD